MSIEGDRPMAEGAEPVRMRTDLGSGGRAMARGAAVNMAGQIAANVIAFGFSLIVAHTVSPHDFGLFSIALTVVMMAQIPALLGLDTGVVRYVARAAAVGDERRARGALQVALGITALTSVVATAVLFIWAPYICDHFFDKPDAADFLRVTCLGLPGMAIGKVAVQAAQGFGIMGYAAWMMPIRVVANLLVALPLLAAGLGAEGLSIASSIAFTITGIASVLVLARVHAHAFRLAPGAWHPGPMLRFSAPQTLAAMMFFAIIWTSTLLLGRYGTAADVAIYTIVGRLLLPATLVVHAIGSMFAPRIAAEDVRGDHPTLARMLKRVTRWNTTVSVPVFAALILIPGPLLGLFGSTYEEGALALAILAFGQFVNALSGPLGAVINMTGRPYVNLVNNILVAGLNVVAGLYLIPRYELIGAAAATAGSLALVNAFKLIQVRWMLGMLPWSAGMLKSLLAATVATLVSAPVAYLPPWPNPLLQVMATLTVLMLTYSALVWRVLGPSDREIVLHARNTIRQRVRAGARRAADAPPAQVP